ncbi:hypothetical protein AAKU58_000800 [Oxalobacteraceae bacterium GrIS 1.18]
MNLEKNSGFSDDLEWMRDYEIPDLGDDLYNCLADAAVSFFKLDSGLSPEKIDPEVKR